MTTLRQIGDAMADFNASAAPGSECNAWQDFVEDCYGRLGFAPWTDGHWNDEVPSEFADYWGEVARGISVDYSAEDGGRLDL